MVHVVPGLFLRHEPEAAPVPVVYDVSRSGREYPPDYRSPVPFTDVHDNVSMYVEELYAAAPKSGATLLYCMVPNTYVDMNRHELDIDPDLLAEPYPVALQPTVSKRGLGLLKTVSRYGKPMHEKKFTVAEIEHRLATYHRPYQAELKRILDETKAKHGVAFQISCHCMSAIGAPTHPDKGQPRADFCIGDMEGTSASPEFRDFLVETLKNMGHSVTANFPYTGGELNRRYGDPKNGVESVMIEINKKLFMDIKTFLKTPGFGEVKPHIDKLIAAIADYARSRAKTAR